MSLTNASIVTSFMLVALQTGHFMLLNVPTVTKNSNAKLQVPLSIHTKTSEDVTVMDDLVSLFDGNIKFSVTIIAVEYQ